jgi:hypothetical protein
MLRIAQCLGTVALALLLIASPTGARADDPPAEPQPQYPQTEIMAYIWGTSLAGKVNSDRGEASFHVSFQDLLKNLNAALMLHSRTQLDEDWSIVADGLWAHLRAPKQSKQVKLGPREGIVVNGELKADMNEFIVEMNAGHKLFRFGSMFSRSPSDTRHVLGEMYFGGRLYAIDPNVHATVTSNIPALNGERSLGNNQTWVDPVVGLRFSTDLSKTTRFIVMGDVGGFNLGGYSSTFSWSQSTILSWDFAESWRLHMGYRFLDFKRDFHSGELKLQTRGPLIAIGYVF